MTPQILIELPEVSGPLQTDRLEVIVAERHIRAGVRLESTTCPVALALREGGHTAIAVGYDWVLVDGRRYPITFELWTWIDSFDRGDPVHPERWVLEPIPSTQKPFGIGVAA